MTFYSILGTKYVLLAACCPVNIPCHPAGPPEVCHIYQTEKLDKWGMKNENRF